MLPQRKKQIAVKLLNTLIDSPDMKPFIDFDDAAFGLYDFTFVARYPCVSLQSIKNRIVEKRSFTAEWLICELKNMFQHISDYLLLGDSLQLTCQYGLNQISKIQKQFQDEKKHIKNLEQIAKQKEMKMNQQLNMIFYMKSYEADQEIIKKIGEVCQMVQETEDQYIIDLSKSNSWEAFITKGNFP